MSGSQQLLLGGVPASGAVDPYFYSVTSLLHGDGTNGAQNNTFLDSSTNNFTITRNGNTTQGSFSPFSQTGWSNYFNGSNSYLSVANNVALRFGTGDFSVEGWVYLSALPSGSTVAQIVGTQWSGTSPGGAWTMWVRGTTNKIEFCVWNTILLTSTTALTANTWYHVAVTRSGTSTKLFINGTNEVTATSSFDYNNSTYTTIIGRYDDTLGGVAYLNGHISNVRLVKGTAVYTANFTPPTAPLIAVSGTSLLTCQSNRFVDNSSNVFAITVGGSPSVQPFSPFNPLTPYSTSTVGGSGYFDGSGDFLSCPDNAALEPGSSDLTWEMWINTASTTQYATLYSRTTATFASGMWSLLINYASSTAGDISLFVGDYSTSSQLLYTNAVNVRDGAWHHIAVVRNGSAWTLYVDGVSRSTGTFAGTIADIAGGPYVGADQFYGRNFSGYISGFRIVKGTAVYTTGFTPPTAPPTAITNTSLLLNYTNGGIFDNAAVADYETVGNAQISTSVKKYGTGSMYFDGTGDWLYTAPSTLTNISGTGDFTIECWVYFNSVSNAPQFLSGYSGSGYNWAFYLNVGGALGYYLSSNGSTWDIALNASFGASMTTGTWYHVALVRVGNKFTPYINGIPGTPTTSSASIYANGQGVYVGGISGYTLDGYIDDLRISRGVGRYPYSFTPPTAEFPNIGGPFPTLTADPYYEYTTLLLPGNGTNGAQNNTFLDGSTNNFTITRNGNTTQGTFSPFSQTGWSNYFDGAGDYLSVADNSALEGFTDFTIEFWAYPTAIDNGDAWLTKGWQTSVYAPYLFYVNGSSLQFYASSNGSSWDVALSANIISTITLNQWVHVAVSRSGSSLRIFCNGTLVTTVTNSTTLMTNASALTIGSDAAGGNTFSGYFSNVRITNTAVYTANFTPSTSPLTAITGTALLTCQSNRFVDNSTNAFAITRNGDVSVQAFSPFNPTASWDATTNGGSGYFDGSGDYLTAPANAAFNFGTGDFTVEAWVYPTSTSGTRPIVEIRTSAANSTGFALLSQSGATTLNVYTNGGFAGASTASIATNAWNHVALVRSGNTWTYYINGASAGSFTNSSTQSDGATTGPKIGGSTTAGEVWVGYMGSVRILKGTAQYTGATYTIPTAPLTAITNTSLLTNFTNAGIYDATSKNDLETIGNAQISTTQSKFGGSSIYIPAAATNVYTPASPNLDFGTGDFTVECWVYSVNSGIGLYPTFISSVTGWSAGASGHRFNNTGAANKFTFHLNGAGDPFLTSANTFSFTTWYHYALTRYGNTWRMFINGNLEASGTYSGSFNQALGGMRLGYSQWDGANGYYNGYIDDLRITKGIARYTSNFTPPTTAFLTL